MENLEKIIGGLCFGIVVFYAGAFTQHCAQQKRKKSCKDTINVFVMGEEKKEETEA